MVVFDIDTTAEKMKLIDTTTKKNIYSVLKGAIINGFDVVGSTVLTNYETPKDEETIIVEPEMVYNCSFGGYGIDMSVASECSQIYFERKSADIWDECGGQGNNLNTYLRTMNVNTVAIIGVGNELEDSVYKLILGLCCMKYKVVVITDAIEGFDYTDIPLTFRESVEQLTTEEFLKIVNEE